ncbi:MAG: hypothetical protein ACXVIP_05305 [Halobacteriota archaeon]
MTLIESAQPRSMALITIMTLPVLPSAGVVKARQLTMGRCTKTEN